MGIHILIQHRVADGSSGRVLIVEDDTAVAEAITAALAASCEYSFDLVLLDHRVPDHLGTHLLKQIKGVSPLRRSSS